MLLNNYKSRTLSLTPVVTKMTTSDTMHMTQTIQTRPTLSRSGFTLIEILIAIAIVGILAAVAVPSYTSYLDKAKRPDAINGINRIAQAQERYYAINGRYARNLLGTHLPDNVALQTSPDGYYSMATTNSDETVGDDFTITATRKAAESSDTECNIFTLTDLGIKSAVDSSSNDTTTQCWKVR